jgi:hypothetical protein
VPDPSGEGGRDADDKGGGGRAGGDCGGGAGSGAIVKNALWNVPAAPKYGVVKKNLVIERKSLESPISREKNKVKIVSGTRPEPVGRAARTGSRLTPCLFSIYCWADCLAPYWQSARALAVHWPKPLATMLRMTAQT